MSEKYYDNETDFCRADSQAALRAVERVFLENRISYYIRPAAGNFLTVFLSHLAGKNTMVMRINERDVVRAAELVRGMDGVEIVAECPKEDWSPKKKLEEQRKKEQQADEEGYLDDEEDAEKTEDAGEEAGNTGKEEGDR